VLRGPEPLAEGGDGKIFRLHGPSEASRAKSDEKIPLLAKLYHDATAERRAKLQAMLRRRPDHCVTGDAEDLRVEIAWPTSIIENHAGDILGFAMPEVDLEQTVVLEAVLSRRSRSAYQLSHSYKHRFVAAYNLAVLVASLHEKGHHVVDLKPLNAQLYRDSFYVSLLDTDGFSISGPSGTRFVGHQYTPGYIAPEVARHNRPPEALGEAQDRFALAVILFQLLNRGLHPFQGVPAPAATVPPTNQDRINAGLYAYGKAPHPKQAPAPFSVHPWFDDNTQQLFDRAFATDPASRPSAADWKAHLSRYVGPSPTRLKPCTANTDHARFGGQVCGLCALGVGETEEEGRKTAPQSRRPQRTSRSRKAPAGGSTATAPSPAPPQPVGFFDLGAANGPLWKDLITGTGLGLLSLALSFVPFMIITLIFDVSMDGSGVLDSPGKNVLWMICLLPVLWFATRKVLDRQRPRVALIQLSASLGPVGAVVLPIETTGLQVFGGTVSAMLAGLIGSITFGWMHRRGSTSLLQASLIATGLPSILLLVLLSVVSVSLSPVLDGTSRPSASQPTDLPENVELVHRSVERLDLWATPRSGEPRVQVRPELAESLAFVTFSRGRAGLSAALRDEGSALSSSPVWVARQIGRPYVLAASDLRIGDTLFVAGVMKDDVNEADPPYHVIPAVFDDSLGHRLQDLREARRGVVDTYDLDVEVPGRSDPIPIRIARTGDGGRRFEVRPRDARPPLVFGELVYRSPSRPYVPSVCIDWRKQSRPWRLLYDIRSGDEFEFRGRIVYDESSLENLNRIRFRIRLAESWTDARRPAQVSIDKPARPMPACL
jgi:ABC-type Co2+ transport system permease subunit